MADGISGSSVPGRIRERGVNSKDSSVYLSSQENNECFCDLCRLDGNNMEAKAFCTQCSEYHCTTCSRFHLKTGASKHHVLLKLERVTLDDLDSEARDVTKSSDPAPAANNGDDFVFVHKIGAKHADEKEECIIQDIALLSDLKLAVIDIENFSLKIIDVENKSIVMYLKLDSCPKGIAVLEQDQLAITFPYKNRIKIFSVKERLSVTRNLRVEERCLGVRCISGNLFVGFSEPLLFKIFKPSGEEILEIVPSYEVGQLCRLPGYIEISDDEKNVFVSDEKANIVLKLDMSGAKIAAYSKLEKPSKLQLVEDSLFICNRDRSNIKKLSINLDESRVILDKDDGLSYSRAMCYSPQNGRLYVSSQDAKAELRNFIHVFKKI